MTHIDTILTRFGPIELETTHLGVLEIRLPADTGVALTPVKRRGDPAARAHAVTAGREVLDYLEGECAGFKTPVDLTWATPFIKDVFGALRAVPFGATVSYADLARISGHSGAARAVGGAMKRNRTPIVIPCHRVIAAGNHIGGWSGPRGWKERLLSNEGVVLPPSRGSLE